MSNVRLVTVGDNCLDVYLSWDRVAVGGNALNVAAQWRRNGWAARYFGAVGDDAEAEIVLDEVAEVGLARADVDRLAGATGVTLLSHDSGDRNFLLEALGVGEGYLPGESRYAEIAAADWVHLGTNSSADLVRRLVSDRVPFSVDISTAHRSLPLEGVPLLFASGSDSTAEPIEALLQSLHSAGAHRVVVTRGRLGSYFYDGTSIVHTPAAPVEVVDTCGAGDSFIASFLASFCFEELGASESLGRAAVAAAETCAHVGGFPQQRRPIPEWLLTKYSAPIVTSAGSPATAAREGN